MDEQGMGMDLAVRCARCGSSADSKTALRVVRWRNAELVEVDVLDTGGVALCGACEDKARTGSPCGGVRTVR